MFCWNCGTRNPEENNFCGRCGKRIAVGEGHGPTGTIQQPQAAPPVNVTDPAPAQANPLVEEPRAVHDSPREMIVNAAPLVVAEPPGKQHVAINRQRETPRTETAAAAPLVMPTQPGNGNVYRLPPNRISGPSFLGLSDDNAPRSSEGDYLLYDDEPRRSSWRAWVAVAVLALLGFLIFKQWNSVKAGAQQLAQRAGAEKPKQSAATTPAPIVTGSDPIPASEDPKPTAPSSAAPSELQKPEADQHAAEPPPSGAVEKTESARSESAPKTNESRSRQQEERESSATDDDQTAPHRVAGPTRPAAPAADPRVQQAQRYLSGDGVAEDCARGIALLRSAARDGNARAQVKLGAMYATGQCVTQDRAAAYQWLARAQEAEPNNGYLKRTMNALWSNMTPEERSRITR